MSAGDASSLISLTAPPRGKTSADKQAADGGFASRAASAGAFSDERVLTAMDLYAAAFSDRKETAKTKDMKAEVGRLRAVVSTWRQLASKGGKMSGADKERIKVRSGEPPRRSGTPASASFLTLSLRRQVPL